MEELVKTKLLATRAHILEEAYAVACQRALNLRTIAAGTPESPNGMVASGSTPIAPPAATTVDQAWQAAMGAATDAETAAAGVSAGGAGVAAAGALLSSLKVVYRTIIGSKSRIGRQIFFVGLGGFDTHRGRNDDLLHGLAYALRTFYEATKEMGVLTFTCSDFGRTLTQSRIVDGAILTGGTEHAWGGTQMVLGRDVNGLPAITNNPFFGEMPDTFFDTTTATAGGIATGFQASPLLVDSRGVMLPKISTAQYLATMGRWYLQGDPNLETKLKAALPILDTPGVGDSTWINSIPNLLTA
jgi:uncharacterized protein (DUF1501 family)